LEVDTGATVTLALETVYKENLGEKPHRSHHVLEETSGHIGYGGTYAMYVVKDTGVNLLGL